jgi:CYTH domain-containing protein
VRLADDATEVAHTSLYLDDAEWDLLVTLPADVLTKTRTVVTYDGWSVAVDVHADGTVVAEVDRGDGPDRALPPDFDVVREVTGDERFTGAGLAAG